MKAKKLFFMECHLAGRIYHDADEVWDELKVGTILKLERDEDNKFDSRAVAVIYESGADEETGEKDEFVLGYIPRNENEVLANLLEMGWNDIFECRINKIDSQNHPENQIRLTIKIKQNGKASCH